MIEFSLVKLKKNRFFRPLKVGSNFKIFLQGKASCEMIGRYLSSSVVLRNKR